MEYKVAYAGLELSTDGAFISVVTNGNKTLIQRAKLTDGSIYPTLVSYLRTVSKEHNLKILSIGISDKKYWRRIHSDLWLQLDIVTLWCKEYTNAHDIADWTRDQFDDEIYKVWTDEKLRIISPLLADLNAYEEITPLNKFKKLKKAAADYKDKSMLFISATPQGGGVAIMRHAIARLFGLLDINMKWYVLEDDAEVFNITKRKFHNVFQSVADPSIHLTDKDKALFNAWSERNYKNLKQAIDEADVLIIDDPQPSGLIPLIRRDMPSKPIIYRSHIQLEAPLANKVGTEQNHVWQFIWNNIKTCDVFISHPCEEFVPKDIPRKKLIYKGATTDPLDGLNKPLSDGQIQYYMHRFNIYLKESGQTPLDQSRPYLTQIARFDPSKGILDLLEMYRLLCNKLSSEGKEVPQLVIAGNGSVDDPDGKPIFDLIMNQLNTSEYKDLKDDVKVIRLPHYDQLLNYLLRGAYIAYQLSHKEGFEIKVSEALMKKKPVIVYNTGGIPLQVKNKVNGFLINDNNTEEVMEKTYELMNDKFLYQKMVDQTDTNVNYETTIMADATFWLEECAKLLHRK